MITDIKFPKEERAALVQKAEYLEDTFDMLAGDDADSDVLNSAWENHVEAIEKAEAFALKFNL